MADAMKLVPADVAVEAITPDNIAYMQRHGDLRGWCERIKASIRPSLASPPAREEAPAEGAGDADQAASQLLRWADGKLLIMPETVAKNIKLVCAALRDRTSEPEAGAVAWRAEKGKQTYLYDTDEEYRMHSARSLGFRITPLYTHPAPASADKLRAILKQYPTIRLHAALDKLAALNEQPQ